MTVTTHSGSAYKEALARDGYVIVPNVLSESQLDELRTAAFKTVERARMGKWPYLRTLPKQFPPWGKDSSSGIWGVQHLMHPELPEHQLFTATYFNPTVISVVKEVLDATESQLVMELYNMLIRPDDDFELRWHRDDIPPTATAEEETERLRMPAWHCQWNMPLYDDGSLIVVPGSHARPRTEAERNVDPFGKLDGEKVVEIKAGDAVFYNNNILHRGAYKSSVERMTLHGSIGHVSGSKERARNVLQHGVGDWVAHTEFDRLDKNDSIMAKSMRDRLLVMGAHTYDHGYSQAD